MPVREKHPDEYDQQTAEQGVASPDPETRPEPGERVH